MVRLRDVANTKRYVKDCLRKGVFKMELWLSGSVILEDVNKIDKLDNPDISGVEFGFLESFNDLEIINSCVKCLETDYKYERRLPSEGSNI